jgi:hypothetical protein
MKKSIDIQDELNRLKTIKPAILKCSYSMSRKIKKRKGLLAMLDPTLAQFIYSIAIKPIGGIPDHLVFLCDERGRTIKMINLTAKPREKPIVIH